MDIIVTKTNRFGSGKHGDSWEMMDDQDIWRVFGLVLLMGLVKKPTLRSYWSTESIFSTPIFNQTIGRDRFFTHLGAIHFVNNTDDRNDNKMFKLGPVLQLICNRLSSVFHPGKFLSLDESLVKWKGRLSFRQYIPSKRSRFGIKLYVLCDAVSGYIHKFSVYIGDEKGKSRICWALHDSEYCPDINEWFVQSWTLVVHGQLL